MAAMGNYVSSSLGILWQIVWNISQNHHMKWCVNRSTTSLLIECGPLEALTPLHFQVARACGSIQVGQGKNRKDLNNIYYTVQFPYHPEHCKNYILPIYLTRGPTKVPGAECPFNKWDKWLDKPPLHQHDEIYTSNKFLWLCNTEG